MATLTASKAAGGIQPKGLRVGLVAVTMAYSVTASLSAGDVIQMVKVPMNATPIYVGVSGGSGACVVKVGDGVSTGRYMATRSASIAMAMQTISSAYVPYAYSTDDTIDILVSAVSTGVASGAFNLIAIFSMDT